MIRRGLEWFGGSVLVYVLVAACSASGGPEKMMSPFTGSPWGGGTTKGDGGGASTTVGGGEGDPTTVGDGDGDKMAQGDGGDTMTGDGHSGGEPMMGDGDSGGMMGTIMDPVPDADAAEDGTRIVNLYRTTADGLKTQEGYWDKELQVQCNFQLAADGKTRCLPAVPMAGISTGTYSDSGCTVPVAVVTRGTCATQAMQWKQVTGSCDAPVTNSQERYDLGAKVSVVYSGSPESCSDATASLATVDAYQIGSRIDPETYAEGSFIHD